MADADDGVQAVKDPVGQAVTLDGAAAAGRAAGAVGLGFLQQPGVGRVEERDGEGEAGAQEEVLRPLRLVGGDGKADFVAGFLRDDAMADAYAVFLDEVLGIHAGAVVPDP